MSTFDNEAIILGLVLRYDTDAAQVVLPELTPDKFIYTADGTFGPDHNHIWQAVADCYLVDGLRPNYINVSTRLDACYHDYLRLLIDQLEKYYHIYTLDAKELAQYAVDIDKAGIIYNVSQHSKRVGVVTSTIDDFERMVKSIHDVSEWVNDTLEVFHTSLTSATGYQHISVAVNQVRERWEQQFNGTQTVILPCGFPTLTGSRLFPIRKYAVIHGLSGSGKSMLVHQINLGTAIGLIVNGTKGCVAINSLEMEQEDLVERYAALLAGIDTTRFETGEIKKEEYKRLLEWLEFVEKLPIFVDDTNFLTTSAMEYRASGLHVSANGPVIQLSSDYGELFKDKGDTEEQRVNQIFRNQFDISREIGASVIAISQSTGSKQDTNRTYLAGPDGTRYSRGVLHGADIQAELWNPIAMKNSGRQFIVPEGLNDIHPWLIIQKYRKGKQGAIPLGWNPEFSRFFDLAMTHSPGHEMPFEHLEKALNQFNMLHLLKEPKKKKGTW